MAKLKTKCGMWPIGIICTGQSTVEVNKKKNIQTLSGYLAWFQWAQKFNVKNKQALPWRYRWFDWTQLYPLTLHPWSYRESRAKAHMVRHLTFQTASDLPFCEDLFCHRGDGVFFSFCFFLRGRFARHILSAVQTLIWIRCVVTFQREKHMAGRRLTLSVSRQLLRSHYKLPASTQNRHI